MSDLDLSRRKEGGSWYVRGAVKIPGSQKRIVVRESTGTTSRVEAETYRDRLRQEIIDRETLGPAHGLTFADCVVIYVEKGGEKRFLKPILERFGTTKVKDLRAADVSAFAAEHYGHMTPASVKRMYYTPLNAVIRRGCKENDLPVRSFEPPRVEHKAVENAPLDWFPQFFAAAHFRVAATVLFLTTTGRRVTETCNLKVGDCDLIEGRALIRKTKSGKPKVIPLTGPMVAAISKLIEIDGSGPDDTVFGYASRWSVNQAIERVCQKAGIKYYSSHRLGRHSFAARVLGAGYDIKRLKEAGGWATLQVVSETYGHLERSEVDRLVLEVGSEVGRGIASPNLAHVDHRHMRRIKDETGKTVVKKGKSVVGTRGIEPLTPTMSREASSNGNCEKKA